MAYIIQSKTTEHGSRYTQVFDSKRKTRAECEGLLQALIGNRTAGKLDDDTWCVEHEYYGDEWCTYYRIREVKR